MGTVTVIYGHAYDGKQTEALETCLNFIRRNQGGHCLYLVRSDVRVQQLRSQVLNELGGYFHFPVTTLPDLIKRLYRQSLGSRREIGALEQALLIEDIFRQRIAEAGSQFCFQRFTEQRGIIKKVQDFLSTTRRHGIVTPQQAEERFRQCSPRRRALYAEITRIMALYTARLDELRVIDETGIFLEMAHQAESGELDIGPWASSPELLVLEGYYELTLPEQQIFSALCNQFEQCVMTIDTPLNPYSPQDTLTTPKPFRIFQELVRYIQHSGFSVQQSPRLSISTEHNARLRLVNGIFNTSVQDGKKIPTNITPGQQSEEAFPDPDFFTVTTYRNKTEEVTAIAREIKRLFRQQSGIALRDIGVTFPIVEQYEHLIYEIFPLFGIPFTMVQGRSLAASPVVITIFRLLEVVLEDYGREALSTLLTSPFVAFARATPADEAFSLDAENVLFLDSLARLQGIVNDKAAWQEKLGQFYETLLEQYENMSARENDFRENDVRENGEDDSREPDTTLPHDEMLALLTDILPTLSELFEELSAFETGTPYPVADWIEMLRQRITRFQIPQSILKAPDRKIRETDAAAFRGFLKVLEALQRQTPASRRLSLEEFYDLLRRAVQPEIYYAPELVEDAVWIMGHVDTRHVQFQYLFFGGLVERDFPGKTKPNIFLSEQETELFGLPTYASQVQETDHLFYANLLNATQHLYLSHPAQEGDTDLLKAVYLENILRWKNAHADSGVGEGESKAGRNASAPKLEEIYTYSELLQWLGAARVQPDSDPKVIDAMLRWLVAQRGGLWGQSFVRGIQMYAARNAEEFSVFDGMLTSAWAQRVLHRRYDRHLYSASEFDLYARCPIRFWFERILRLAPLQEMPQDISSQEIGSLLHRIVYRFYAESPETQLHQREGNVDVAFLHRKADKAAWLQEAKTRLRQIIREELEAYDYSGVFWEHFTAMLLAGLETETLDRGSNDQRIGLFSAFLEQEITDDDVMLPWFVHANFGLPESSQHDDGYLLSGSPLWISVQNGKERTVAVTVCGQIDRIDVERETEADVRRVVVYDYKTGTPPSIKKIREGVSFQLPLYLLAVQEFLGAKYQVVAGGYYQLKSPTEVGRKSYLSSKESARYLNGSPRGLLETHAEFHQILEQCKDRVMHVAKAIRNGYFHPTTSGPQEAGCSYCPYQQICRVDHQRMKANVKRKT